MHQNSPRFSFQSEHLQLNSKDIHSDTDNTLTSETNNTEPVPILSSSSIKLECPINMEPIRLPVITNDGHTYDFMMIASWIINSQNTEPQTRAPITALILNRAFRNESVVLSLEEKNTIADFCIKLQLLCPNINLSSIISIEGIQELIDSQCTERTLLNSNTLSENQFVNQITDRAELIQEIKRLEALTEPGRDFETRAIKEFMMLHFPNTHQLMNLSERLEEMEAAMLDEHEEEEPDVLAAHEEEESAMLGAHEEEELDVLAAYEEEESAMLSAHEEVGAPEVFLCQSKA